MCGMDERPEQRPEGALIAAALKRSRMSQRKAAELSGISENRLRAIVHGYQNVGVDTYVAVKGPADTVARIADVVGVTPDQLEQADRADAAAALRELATPDPSAGADLRDEAEESQTWDPLAGLPEDPDERIRELSRRLQRVIRATQEASQQQAAIAAEFERISRPESESA